MATLSHPRTRADAIERRIRRLGNLTRARALQRFFKTGPGEYGEGDRFLGLTMPQVRTLASELSGTPLEVLEQLLASPWHEVRMLALVTLANTYSRSPAARQNEIYRIYLRHTNRINNWDLIDVTAPTIVGGHLLTRSRRPLRKLARSSSLWERRIAMVATQAFIRHGEFEDTLVIAEMLLDDRHDLIHKAVGWMLREVGKRDQRVLTGFLDAHAHLMPRTALRYALERLSPTRRKHYMRQKVR